MKDRIYAVAALRAFYEANDEQLRDATLFWVPTKNPVFAQIQLDHAADNLRKLKGAQR